MSSERVRVYGAPFIAAICFCLAGPALAAGIEPASNPDLEWVNGLRNSSFVGSIGPQGEASRSEEVLTFEDGLFSSRVCHRYGFPPAPYWVRRDDDGLHFLARLENPDNGTIRFRGTFDGKIMRATARWTKERWYWTVEQTLVFEGRPAAPPE